MPTGIRAARASDTGSDICARQGGLTTAFDPDALERGAKALREINNSPHGKLARRPACLLHSNMLDNYLFVAFG